MSLLNKLFNFVSLTTKTLLIDESHGIKHSMDILNFAHNIYKNEVKIYPILKDQERVIYVSAIVHDMCDKKYINEDEGIQNIQIFLKNEITCDEIKITKDIISTMSYSTVKKLGFPSLKDYQIAYHIVREADLLCAYDFDRCMIYNINKMDGNINDAFTNAEELFNNRVLKQISDNLYFTDYSKKIAPELHNKSIIRLNDWKNIINNPIFK
jgi:hypothetical protein